MVAKLNFEAVPNLWNHPYSCKICKQFRK